MQGRTDGPRERSQRTTCVFQDRLHRDQGLTRRQLLLMDTAEQMLLQATAREAQRPHTHTDHITRCWCKRRTDRRMPRLAGHPAWRQLTVFR